MADQRLKGETSGNPFAGGIQGNLGLTVASIIVLASGAGLLFVPVSPNEAWMKPFITGALLLFGFIILARLILRIRGRVVSLEADPTSLRWVQRGEQREQRWEQVAAVRRSEKVVGGAEIYSDPSQGSQIGSVHLDFQDGSSVEFDRQLSNYDAVAAAVQVYAHGAILKRKEAEMVGGGATFGPVTLRKEGVTYRDRQLLWRDVNYNIANGHLRFAPAESEYNPRRDMVSIRLADVPNYLVLLEMMERLGKPAASLKQFAPPSQRASFI